ncbi:MAG TPA: hypothetical protein VD907_01910 [Verrucomicrobiae bacterium]|nr:hypothetical protein [Verrucomicrobiae bacterium]
MRISLKKTAHIGIIAGLTASLIYLLAPHPRGITVFIQCGALIILGAVISYFSRKKIHNPYAVIIYSMLIGYGTVRVLPFVTTYWLIAIGAIITASTALAYFLWRQYFALKTNFVVKYSGAVLLVIVWWVVIPLTVLYFIRLSYTP